jgi:hypothetical protein
LQHEDRRLADVPNLAVQKAPGAAPLTDCVETHAAEN